MSLPKQKMKYYQQKSLHLKISDTNFHLILFVFYVMSQFYDFWNSVSCVSAAINCFIHHVVIHCFICSTDWACCLLKPTQNYKLHWQKQKIKTSSAFSKNLLFPHGKKKSMKVLLFKGASLLKNSATKLIFILQLMMVLEVMVGVKRGFSSSTSKPLQPLCHQSGLVSSRC